MFKDLAPFPHRTPLSLYCLLLLSVLTSFPLTPPQAHLTPIPPLSPVRHNHPEMGQAGGVLTVSRGLDQRALYVDFTLWPWEAGSMTMPTSQAALELDLVERLERERVDKGRRLGGPQGEAEPHGGSRANSGLSCAPES